MQNKKVLITGGCGFVGHHFVEHFIKNTDWDVIIFDKLTYASSGYERLRDIDVYDNKRISIYSVDLTLPISDGILKEIYGVDYILHLAAESHVDRSIEDPYPFLMSNVLGTHNMLWFARKLDSLKGFLNFSCYDGETRALTSNGFKSYNEIEVGDKVLSINPDTNEFEEKEVDDIIIQDYDGEMISFKGQRVDIKVTPNHRMYYKKGKNNQILIDEAQNIYNKTNLSLINGDWNGIKSDFTYIKNIGYVNTNDLFYLTGIFIGDGFLAPQTKEHKSKSGLTKKERDVSEKCRDSQTGRYISTKKIGNNDIILSKTWRVYIDVPENDKARKKLEKILSNLKINWHAQKNKSGEHIYFSSEEWSNYFEQFGKYAKNKNIPNWVLKYDKNHLEYLFDGLIDSDGYYGKGWTQYTTVSEKLLKDICELGFKINRYPNFRSRYSKNYINGRKIEGNGYYILFPKTIPKIPKNLHSKKHYNGKIWCLKVRDNKNFIIERNGKLAISGNTDECYGPAPQGVYFKEWDRHKSSNPYAATKAAAEELCISYENTYNLPIFITKTMNCFTGDTKIPLLDGTESKIKDLVNKEFYVYSYDIKNRKPTVGRAHNCKMTMKNAEIYEVLLDNGKKIKCTKDHLFLLRDGTYKEAQYLSKNDSLMPLYRKMNKDDREEVYNVEQKEWEKTHNLAYEYKYGIREKYMCAHHVDFNRHNNSPDNILSMEFKTHIQFHSTQARKLMKKLTKMGLHPWQNLSKTQLLKRAETKKKLGQYDNLINKLMEWKRDPKNIEYWKQKIIEKKQENPDQSIKDLYNISHGFLQKRIKDYRKIYLNNHKVVSVKKVGYDDVYDFTVDVYHNFALSAGVFVHNCYGERQHPEKFIPMCIKKILNDETMTIHADKSRTQSGTRHWIHARNVADAILFLTDKFVSGDKYNIVGEEISNLEIAQIIADILNKKLKYEMVDFHSSRPGHDLRYAMDGSKLKNMGWEPPKNVYDSLEKTIKWTIDNKKWLNI